MEQLDNYIYLIKELETLLRPRFIRACAGEAVTWTQYTTLTVLERRPGITSSELARRSFVRTQSMAATIEALLDAGLVRREQDPKHGRRQLLFLTPAGEDAVVAVAPSVRALESDLVQELSPKERRQFADYLRRCRHALVADAMQGSSGQFFVIHGDSLAEAPTP